MICYADTPAPLKSTFQSQPHPEILKVLVVIKWSSALDQWRPSVVQQLLPRLLAVAPGLAAAAEAAAAIKRRAHLRRRSEWLTTMSPSTLA